MRNQSEGGTKKNNNFHQEPFSTEGGRVKDFVREKEELRTNQLNPQLWI